MAQDTTKLIVDIESRLRNLEKTLRGIESIRKALQSVANVKVTQQSTAAANNAVNATQRLQQAQQRASIAAQRLANQQQAVNIRTQQLANAQTKAQQTTQRLTLAQQKLDNATANVSSRLGQQADAHVKAFRAIEAASKRTTQHILGIGNALRSVGQGLASLGATLTVGLTAPLAAAGVASVDAAVRLDSLKRGLTAIVGSADEANRQLARLTQIAKLPGIGFEEAIQGSIRLQAVGFSALEAERNLREFANAIALTGGGRDELARVTVQLGQLAAKGKVLSQDLRPIIEAAPAVGRALLEAFGTVNSDDIQALGLSTREFLTILVSQLGELPRAAAGAKNSFENFRDEVFRATAAIGEALLPGLIRLAEIAGPIITRLADAFTKLPQPLQLAVIGTGALLAALGPVAFVVGQLVLGVGRLAVGFVELNAAGILPSIASMRAYAVATLNAAAAQRTLFATSVAVGGGLGAIVTVLAAAAGAYLLYNAFQKDATALSKERADQLTREIKSLEEQAKFLNGLESGVERTADEQQRLLDIYDKLNITAQTRIAGISEEEKRLLTLRAELEKLIQLRQLERQQQTAALAGELADTLRSAEVNQNRIDAITAQIQANTELAATIEKTGRISAEASVRLAEGGLEFTNAGLAVRDLRNESEALTRVQRTLLEEAGKLNGTAREQGAALRALGVQTVEQAREVLSLAKNMGVFKGSVEDTLPALQKYIEKTEEATRSTDGLNRSLSGAAESLLKSGEKADVATKARRALIEAAAAQAREVSVDFQGALRDIQRTVDAVPELRQALQRESELTGKSMEALLREALQSAFRGRERERTATGLRNAQEQLQQAIAEAARAGAEQQATIERLKNERLLELNENSFRLQLISYRAYLSERARLTSANLGLEIDAQKAIINEALAEAERFKARAGRGDLPAAERTRAAAGAAAAEERAVKAQTKILELTQRQRDARTELGQLLAESAQQQEKDVRQLDIEFAELGGRIEDALNTATVERFREQLEALGKAQIDIAKRLEVARLVRDKDEEEELLRAQRLNQSQIDLIEGIAAQEQATNRLTAAQRLIEQAKERQAQLEQQLTFEVEHRGLSEEEAIRRRLEGEQRLANSLRLSRNIIADTITQLQARGVEPPRALIDFIREIDTEIRGLGELPFSEQFRLVEKEFNRLNDERIQRIQDVERAVRNRDIAEIEGMLLIRRINGEYAAALEQQLVLLRQIAEASGQDDLRRQAAQAGEVVKDTRDQVADLGKQIESAGKDAFRSGLTDFFSDILNRTATAKEALLNLVNSVATAINNVIAENLSKELFESIFGGGEEQAGGLIASVRRLFGFGGGEGAGATGGVAASAAGAVEAAAATTALTTGATAAATALTTGGATAAATLATSITAAAASFSAAVIAAGAAFAAAVGAASATQTAAAFSGSGIGNFAVGDILQPQRGGVLARLAEGGYPEAVLTTDPRHAVRQASILREYLKETRGLFGRIPGFASGVFIDRQAAEMNMLSSIQRAAPLSTGNVSGMALASSSSGGGTIRQIFVDDQRDISNWVNSAEGDRVQIQWLARNRVQIRRLLGVREG